MKLLSTNIVLNASMHLSLVSVISIIASFVRSLVLSSKVSYLYTVCILSYQTTIKSRTHW